MRRRAVNWTGLGITALAVGIAGGCRSSHPSPSEIKTVDPHAPEAVEFDPNGVHAVDMDGKAPATPFFKNNRKAGGLSSEAREIERSLGVQ